MQPGDSNWSLSRRLLWVMIIALTALAIGLGVVGTLLISRVVEESFDKLLGASVQEIAGSVTLERGNVIFNIPPSAFGILENEQRDSVFYSIRQGDRLLTGYEDLPIVVPDDARPGVRAYEYVDYRGQRTRIAVEARYLPRMSDPVVVQVAQTLGERRSLLFVILVALYALELSFIVIGALLIWPALKWSLSPVRRLREELDARPTDQANFEPLDLHYAPAELGSLIRGFNHLLKRLEGTLADVRQFTADASHQMRTPLAVVKTHLTLLEPHVPPETPGAKSLEDFRVSVAHLELLLTRLISLAHADETARGGIARSRIDLREVITVVTGELLPQAVQSDITLSVNAKERPIWVVAEPVLAAEILSNLVDNSIRYNRPGGNVCISVEETAKTVILSIEDDGPGIPEADQKHIFERFYRLPRDREKRGSGLGLSIVRTLGGALHASVAIETPSDGRGLRVSVEFESAK